MNNEIVFLSDALQTESLGKKVAQSFQSKRGIIYLEGELGAGKTTLVRGLLKALGFKGSTKSPTYTLVEPYELETRRVFHFDLYRLSDPDELEYLGVDEYFSEANALIIIEWPDKGGGWLPSPDLVIRLSYKDLGREATMSYQE